MGRITMPPTGERFKRRVEEWLQTLTEHDFVELAERRDQLISRLEALYRSMHPELDWQH